MWEGARELESYLLHSVPSFEGLRVLELGAGLGWLALRLASLGAVVVATEQAAMLSTLQLNIAKHEAAHHAGPQLRVKAAELDWLEAEESRQAGRPPAVVALTQEAGGWDLIVGADCVYLEEFFAPLLSTVGAAVRASAELGAAGRVLLSAEHRTGAHVTHDRNAAAALFFGDPGGGLGGGGDGGSEALAACGFRPARKVWENERNEHGHRVAAYALELK